MLGESELDRQVLSLLKKGAVPTIAEVVKRLDNPEAIIALERLWTKGRIGLAVERKQEPDYEVNKYRVYLSSSARMLIKQGKLSSHETGQMDHFPTRSNGLSDFYQDEE